jgi:hypothetical protein
LQQPLLPSNISLAESIVKAHFIPESQLDSTRQKMCESSVTFSLTPIRETAKTLLPKTIFGAKMASR